MSEYGLTFYQIRQMTYREISIAYKSIIKRKNREMKFQAACVGATIKDNEDEDEKLDQSHLNDKIDLIEKISKETMERKGFKRATT